MVHNFEKKHLLDSEWLSMWMMREHYICFQHTFYGPTKRFRQLHKMSVIHHERFTIIFDHRELDILWCSGKKAKLCLTLWWFKQEISVHICTHISCFSTFNESEFNLIQQGKRGTPTYNYEQIKKEIKSPNELSNYIRCSFLWLHVCLNHLFN